MVGRTDCRDDNDIALLNYVIVFRNVCNHIWVYANQCELLNFLKRIWNPKSLSSLGTVERLLSLPRNAIRRQNTQDDRERRHKQVAWLARFDRRH